MKSLSELADTYEKWATANEARAAEILACQDSYAYEVREHQLWRASQLMADAAALKTELRKLDGGMAELLDVSRTPEDRDQECDAPRTTRPNRLR